MRFKPDAKKIGPRAGKYLKAIVQALEKPGADPHKVEVDGQTFELAPDEIITMFEGPENLKCSLEQGTFMALDTALTPELLQEGVARDFNRLIQDQRKALGLDISDRIVVNYSAPPRIADAIATHQDYLKSELLAERLEPSAHRERRREAIPGRRRHLRHNIARMRTTVTLDPDVNRLLKDCMKHRGISFKQALNDAVRNGLAGGTLRSTRPFVQKSFSLGHAQDFHGDKALAITDCLEDEEIGRKLSIRSKPIPWLGMAGTTWLGNASLC